MKRNIKNVSVKLASALLIAATTMSISVTAVRADEINTEAVESVETVVETSEETEAASEVEGQGDIIDDQFAVAPEAETQPAAETVAEAPAEEMEVAPEVEGQGDIIDDEFAVTEGWGDVIDDEFAVAPEVEGQEDIIDDQFAVDQSVGGATQNESKPEAKKTTKAPAVDMSFYHYTFVGYHGDRVDYENLVPGKFYLMQIPGNTTLPSFSYRVVKINGSYTDDGKVMVTYDKYKTNGKLEGRNKKTQANVTVTHLKPNHFFEITNDILAK